MHVPNSSKLLLWQPLTLGVAKRAGALFFGGMGWHFGPAVAG